MLKKKFVSKNVTRHSKEPYPYPESSVSLSQAWLHVEYIWRYPNGVVLSPQIVTSRFMDSVASGDRNIMLSQGIGSASVVFMNPERGIVDPVRIYASDAHDRRTMEHEGNLVVSRHRGICANFADLGWMSKTETLVLMHPLGEEGGYDTSVLKELGVTQVSEDKLFELLDPIALRLVAMTEGIVMPYEDIDPKGIVMLPARSERYEIEES